LAVRTTHLRLAEPHRRRVDRLREGVLERPQDVVNDPDLTLTRRPEREPSARVGMGNNLGQQVKGPNAKQIKGSRERPGRAEALDPSQTPRWDRHRCGADRRARQMQRSTGQHDDLPRLPRPRSGEGGDRGTTAARHRHRSPARCSRRMVTPARDARFVALILAVQISATSAGARNGFAAPRDRAAKSPSPQPWPPAETARPAFEPPNSPAIAGLFVGDRERPFGSD
jgi:hypothetical protein